MQTWKQAEAIDQITQGLEQIDQVTQSNTASAEESAAAAEELASQSVQLKILIQNNQGNWNTRPQNQYIQKLG
jgi:methyl-accepting chemotaxis protein